MRISVFGIGYVGAVACGCLARMGHEVVGVDIAEAKVALLASGRSPIVEAEIGEIIAGAVASRKLRATNDVAAAVARTDLSFIAVGTPSGPDGALSMAAVEEVCAAIGRALRDKATPHTVVMRSTVPPGTGEERAIPILAQESGRAPGQGLSYLSNPEFLREGTAVADFHAPPMTLIGAMAGDDASVLRDLYTPTPGAVHVVPLRVAESVKYLSNAYHAVKLAFANEAGQILAAHGVDAPEAFRLFREDRALNISPAYLRPGFAFGGSCLPKDIRGILALGAAKRVPTTFLSSVLPSNEALVERTFARIAAGGRQKVALFGLAFKPGTDDLRESPFVALAERLIGRGFELAIFDRHVEVARLVGSNRAYIEREIPHLERLLVADAAQAARACRVAVVGHIGAGDQAALSGALTDQRVIDLAGVAALRAMPGIAYEGICW
jgi:GDP-mannose 6-dehydrogenase